MLPQLDGCVVQPSSQHGPSKQILHVRLTPELLQRILNSDGEQISVDLGKNMHVQVGDTRHPCAIATESTSIDVYRYKSNELTRTGVVSHRLTVRRELDTSVSEKLKARQAQEMAAKQERSVQTWDMDARPLKRKAGALSAPRPGGIRSDSPARLSPFLQARRSPLLVASAPKSPNVTLHTRLLQALAVSAATEKELASKLRAPIDSLTQILPEIAQASLATWSLKDSEFLSVKVWDWKGYTTAERSAVISRAAEAYDRLGLPAKHSARIKLIHPEKRLQEERDDTSPLSLGPATSGSTEHLTSSGSTQQMRDARLLANPQKSSDAIDSPSHSHKKVTAKGILSTGKQEKKKKNVDTANKTATAKTATPASTSTSRDPAKLSALPKNETKTNSNTKTKTTTTTTTGSRLPPTHLPAVTPSPEKPAVSFVPKRIVVVSQPNRHDGDVSAEILDHALDDRTASITSTSSNQTDHTTMSAKSSATAATSVSITSPNITKPRSKFLTTKKATSTTLFPKHGATKTRPAQAPNERTEPNCPKETATRALVSDVLNLVAEPTVSSVPSTKKRSCVEELKGSPATGSVKRIKSIDLQDMARNYKKQYPEYKDLHAEIASKVGDATLLSKFMEMHNEMSHWKQTLYAAEDKYPS